jgi:hypothetical protein
MSDLIHDLVFELHGTWNEQDKAVIWPVSFWEYKRAFVIERLHTDNQRRARFRG